MSLNKSAFAPQTRFPSLVIHAIAILLSTGYSVYHLLFGELFIGLSASLSTIFCACATVSFLRGKPRAIHYYFYYGFQFPALIATCYLFGLRGLILIYPITASLFYMLSYRIAFWIALMFFIFALGSSYHHFETDMIIRIGVALFTSIIIAAGFSYISSKQQRLFEHDATHDYLTEILNRRGLILRLSESLKKLSKKHEDLAVFFLDLDGFKRINDRYGHDVGDKLLTAFVARTSSSLRYKKQNTGLSLFARISGDEFVLTIPNVNQDEAKNIAERLISACKHPFNIDKELIEIGVSIGVTFASHENYDVDAVLKCSDLAMYQAKKSGSSRYSLSWEDDNTKN